MMLRVLPIAAILASTLAASPALAAEEWPSRPITIMGGFPGGAGTDLYARKLGESLTPKLNNQPIVVDNRTGAGGNVASEIVSRAEPDGYTFLLGTAGTHAINAALYTKLSFDVEKDFTRIAILGDVPNVLLVSPKKHPDIKDCAGLIALAKKQPGRMNYSSTGNGSSGHLAGAQFTRGADVEVMHVPYRGQGPAMTALLAGEVDFFFNQSAPSIAQIKAGTARPLAVTSAERIAALPDVPTVAEACDIAGYESTTWYALFAPAGLPAEIQQRMSKAVTESITTPEFEKWLVEIQGVTPPADPGIEAFEKIHKADLERWAKVVKESGAKVD